MKFSTIVSTAVLASSVLAFPNFSPEEVKRAIENHKNCKAGHQEGRLFVIPPAPTDTSSKKIPDADHPYMPPGPNDTRGPCPMLNSLANHGYVDRSGVDTSENIIKAVREGGNMEADFSAFVVSFATMARGNPNTAMLSIGFESDKVPPLPGCIDGPVAGGLAKHGRFEGDVSSSRTDAGIGDAVNFNSTMFAELLRYVAQYADDGPEGPKTVVNIPTFQEFKYNRFLEDQAEDKELQFHIGRELTTYTEVAFILELMQDGRYNQTSVRQMTSFFQNQTFGDDFYRRQGPGGAAVLSPVAGQVRDAHPIAPGANDANGNYIIDTPAFTNFNCDGYYDLATNQLAGSLNKTHGILRKNIETMTAAMFKPFHDVAGCTMMGFPSGPAGA